MYKRQDRGPTPLERLEAWAERRLPRLLVATAMLASAALWWPAPAGAATPAKPAPGAAVNAAANLALTTGGQRRIKEVAGIQGVRPNQLVGYGLVVGLDGTGDQTTSAPFTAQSLNAMLQQMGVTVPPGTAMQLRNVAAVMVTATLPAFAQPGQALDAVSYTHLTLPTILRV